MKYTIKEGDKLMAKKDHKIQKLNKFPRIFIIVNKTPAIINLQNPVGHWTFDNNKNKKVDPVGRPPKTIKCVFDKPYKIKTEHLTQIVTIDKK